ncbi:E3 ubiquitin-protein ligase RNF13-like [Oscarella lobularis]|uniref:E3 ubiquitin-protein ligase RNF13-like n=1 Tax=Oscarella lobularis TaxID=121494 RepID=UPI003313DF80
MAFTRLGLVLFVIYALGSVEAKVYVYFPNNTTIQFKSIAASFGPPIPDNFLGKLAYATPSNACEEVKEAPKSGEDDPYGWFAIVDRGDCNFDTKVVHCQNANYHAVVVVNGDNNLEPMGGGDEARYVLIPSTMVTKDTGDYLKEHAVGTQNASVIVQLTQEDFYLSWDVYLVPFSVIVGLCIFLTVTFVIVKVVSHRRHVRRWRFPRASLKKIPTRRYKEGTDREESCAICLEDYKNGDKIRVLPCQHIYHSKCVDPWLTRSKRQCPVCKRRILDNGTCEEMSGDQTSMSSDLESSFGSFTFDTTTTGDGTTNDNRNTESETTPLIGSPVRDYSGVGDILRMPPSPIDGDDDDNDNGEEETGLADTKC